VFRPSEKKATTILKPSFVWFADKTNSAVPEVLRGRSKGTEASGPVAFGPQVFGPKALWLKGSEGQRFVGRELLRCTPIHRGVASDSRAARGQMERLIDRFVEVSVSEVSAKQVCTTLD
jgi:hypothetical protein